MHGASAVIPGGGAAAHARSMARIITGPEGKSVIRISDELSIADEEISFEFSRSRGPGGQNVNKVSTKATLLFDVANSPSLSAEQRSKIRKALRTRITKAGLLRVTSQAHRTQRANREAATEKLIDLLRDALKPMRPRRKTKPPNAARERRLQEKRRRSVLKRGRRALNED
jgi:ribosome-associated protein